ncbi:PaaI family thioesterase [Shouchella shacheensis]|uniref:PaaI family thioesterase n=1 Tax=Shouchella shacheensis TaxID=1649580 RepID=UPI000ADE6E46|nr:PaaI family thioesterase [Shouchella shacheensis]
MTHRTEKKNVVEAIFSESPFWNFMGFEIESFEEGAVCLKVEVREELKNVIGTLHGGVYAAMMDTAMGITARSVENTPLATINMNVNYLRPVSEGTIYAKGRVINRSRSLFTVQAEVMDDKDQLAAHAVGSFKRVRPRE